jgi:hypothetical protein
MVRSASTNQFRCIYSFSKKNWDLRLCFLIYNIQISNKIKSQLFGILNFSHCDLPFDLAQGGGESFDSAQDREPVERLVEPFVIRLLAIVI